MINERYVPKNKVGEGRSKVFLCSDIENPSEDIAIKILSEKADNIEKENFQNEFITLRRLRHPNIVQALNFGTIVKVALPEKEIKSGSQYFTLEYFNGKPLLDYSDINNEDSLRKIVSQVCSVLFYLHQSNFIYYDLKPDNILVKKIDGEPFVKLIDLGFAKKSDNHQGELKPDKYIRGTAEFIAPELLKKGKHDNRVDLYSLGIILYRIVFKKFPFDIKNELKVYKAHLEQDFKFPKSKYSEELINVIKKLLEKEPDKRYTNSLEILSDLNIPISNKLVKDWSPAKIFVNRKDVLNILDTYIKDKTSSEIFSIKGFEGSGKTALAEEIDFIYKNSVQVRYDKSKSGYSFLKYFLKKIIFNDFIYPNISEEAKKNLENILKNSSTVLIDELKGIFARITQESDFILILDNFNNYDNFTVEMLKDILPILQVNKIKIIVMEDSDFDFVSDSFHNVKEINLTPFTDVQVSELLKQSYNKFFPVEELKKIILLYADLLPGSIEGFIKDCLQLNIFQYNPKQITINITEKTAKLLKSSHDQIYEVRLSSISKKGIEAVKILSLFELNLDEKILADLLHSDKNDTFLIIEELRDNNILHPLNIGANLQFTSEGLKKHVYSKIENKKEYHINAGKTLIKKYPGFDRNELARQFEIGEDYETCYKVLKEEIKEAEKVSALSYKKGLLKHLENLPLSSEKLYEVKMELSITLRKLNEYKECFELTNLLLKENRKELELSIQKGTCLIALREIQTGKELLLSILSRINDPIKREEVRLEIAYAYFDLNNYEDAEKICYELLQNKKLKDEIKARVFNLMALIDIYFKNNLNSALTYFKKGLKIFEELRMLLEVSKIEINIGNIYNIQGINKDAETYWKSASDINISLGNILQEAYTKINFGIYYYNNFIFDKAIANYKRAYDIYFNLGLQYQQGQILYNLGETYLSTCEYKKCLDSLTKAEKIFKDFQNTKEEIEVLFLLGKLYFAIGDKKRLKIILNESLELNEKYISNSKYEYYVLYLKQLDLIINGEFNNIDSYTEIADIFLELDDTINYIKAYLLLAETFINKNMYEKAETLINNKDLIERCESKTLFKAERFYLLGKIHDQNTYANNGNPLEWYSKSLELIENENISELTWKILLELARYYSHRGNYTKANDYIKYTREVIKHILGNIEDNKLAEIYMNSMGRKDALKILEYLESQSNQ